MQIQNMDVDEGSDQKLDFLLFWIRQHGPLLGAFLHYVISIKFLCAGFIYLNAKETPLFLKW